ncbi:MAG: transporter substrate-binding domain-containing protein [Vibrio sp.]|uniref:substrate-binding periplasmic protein n=1 Tax=Vibrio sp. TaxID=678 RepID=UPI001EB1DE9D|nr:transporter substrate-binding domain-containing protein [Vibrio sp.]NRB68399.1 transporter substrate-binding domain-containing protein [Vibrio sp.]
MIVRIIIGLTLYLLFAQVTVSAKVVWAIQDEWPPYVIDSHDVKGLAHEIVEEAFAVQGYNMKYTIKPWSRALREVATQRYDIALTVWKSSERLEYLYYSDAYLTNSLIFVTLKSNTFDYDNLKSLNGKRIGVIRGYVYDDAFMHSNDFDRLDADNLATNVKKLKTGRIDALIADKIFFRWFVRNSGMDIDEFALIEKPLAANPLYIATSRDHPKKEQIISAFNSGLKVLQQSGRISAIFEKYE